MPSSRFRKFVGLLGIAVLLGGCTGGRSSPKLSPGRAVLGELGAPAAPTIDQLEISARPAGITPWTLRLERDGDGVWRVTTRSDLPENGGDRADGKLVAHFVEILASFATEVEAGNGNDATFGLNPYRLEVRIGRAPDLKILRLGDPTGPTGVYFRVGETAKETWIGRGALLAFLPTIDRPDAFVSKSPFAANLDEIRNLTLEKLQGPDRAEWTFARVDGGWMQGKRRLGAAESALLERLVRQRIARLAAATPAPELQAPDWRLRIQTAKSDELLTLAFPLNEVLGRNPARSERALILYPEFAGALRAFTQARFTPTRSGTKK